MYACETLRAREGVNGVGEGEWAHLHCIGFRVVDGLVGTQNHHNHHFLHISSYTSRIHPQLKNWKKNTGLIAPLGQARALVFE